MSKQPICCFTGDNHLRVNTWVKHPTLQDDAFVSWSQIVQSCCERQLPLLLLGDLFDSKRPDSVSVAAYLQGVTELSRHNVRLYYVEGNHDAASLPWAALAAHAKPARRFDIAGIPACGISYAPRQQLIEQLQMIPTDTRLLLAHQSWLEIQRVGHVDGQFDMIPHGLVMLTGDYHVCGTYHGLAANGEPVVAYSPGSTAMQALNEPPDKYYGVLFDDLSVEWVKLETRPYVSVTCQTSDDVDELITRLPTINLNVPTHVSIRKPILRVRYVDTIHDAYNRLTSAAAERFHLFLEPQHQTTTHVVDVANVPATSFQNMLSAVAELCNPNSVEYQAATRLLTTNDLQSTIAALYQEHRNSYLAAAASVTPLAATTGH